MTDQDSNIICITMQFKKSELICCTCYEPLTKEIFQCSTCITYVCGTCEPKISNRECPTCKHHGHLIRNRIFEHQLIPHLNACTNAGCNEKFLCSDSLTQHALICKFAPITCSICNRGNIDGNIDAYSNHLKNYCDVHFAEASSNEFKKRIRYTHKNNTSCILKFPNYLLVIRNESTYYSIFAVKNGTTELKDYTHLICSYANNGIEQSMKLPISNLNEPKNANIYIRGDLCLIIEKDVICTSQPKSTPTSQPSHMTPARNFPRFLDEAFTILNNNPASPNNNLYAQHIYTRLDALNRPNT